MGRTKSRSPYGERGLKCRKGVRQLLTVRRSPYGERGLKLRDGYRMTLDKTSLSLRRAWIEITFPPDIVICAKVALLTESVD